MSICSVPWGHQGPRFLLSGSPLCLRTLSSCEGSSSGHYPPWRGSREEHGSFVFPQGLGLRTLPFCSDSTCNHLVTSSCPATGGAGKCHLAKQFTLRVWNLCHTSTVPLAHLESQLLSWCATFCIYFTDAHEPRLLVLLGHDLDHPVYSQRKSISGTRSCEGLFIIAS